MAHSSGGIIGLITGLALTVVSAPGIAGDAESGRQTFARWCTSCHATAASASVRDTAPPLAAIVQKPSLSPDALKRWLADPHPPMPNLSLGRLEIENLVAYIESLRRN